MQRRWTFLAVTAIGVVAGLVAFTSLAAGSTAGTKVRVLLGYYTDSYSGVKVSPTVVKAGSVTFLITNASNVGDIITRFVLVKTNLPPGKLPVKNGIVSEQGRIGKALVLQPHKSATPMARSANAATKAADVSGDGGTGVLKGIMKVISQSSRTPRSTRKSCSRSAHSLGAGGHLNGAPHTPTTARPRENVGSTSASRAAAATE
jgi:hypothetical protein